MTPPPWLDAATAHNGRPVRENFQSWFKAESSLEKRGVLTPTFKDILVEMGHDGIVYLNVGETPDAWGENDQCGHDSFIVFCPEQVKSAIGNAGLYLPQSASMTDQDAVSVWRAQRARDAVRVRSGVSP